MTDDRCVVHREGQLDERQPRWIELGQHVVIDPVMTRAGPQRDTAADPFSLPLWLQGNPVNNAWHI